MPITHVRVIDTGKSHYMVDELPQPADWNADHTGTIEQGDVTNLVSDLSNKSDVGHTHEGGSGDMTKVVYDPANKNAQLAAVTDIAVDANLSAAAQNAITIRHANTLDHDGSAQDAAIAGKANTSHTHAPTDITGTAVITNDSRLSDDRTPTSHDNTKHSATYITTASVTYETLDANADVGTSAGQLAIGNHTHPGGSEAFPVGAVFLSVVSTNPNTLLGYGTWSAFGAGKVLVGLDSGDADFDTVEEVGGAKTVQSSAQTFVGDALASHQHDGISAGTPAGTINAHTAGRKGGTTNPQDIFNAPGTHTFTGSALASHQHAGITAGTPTGTNTPGVATSVVQPYVVCYFWKRTA